MDPILFKIGIKVLMSMKKFICAVSVRLAVSNDRLFLWKKQTTNVRLKPLVSQKHRIHLFGLKLLARNDSQTLKSILFKNNFNT